jgi:hypothetical protein
LSGLSLKAIRTFGACLYFVNTYRCGIDKALNGTFKGLGKLFIQIDFGLICKASFMCAYLDRFGLNCIVRPAYLSSVILDLWFT